MRNINEIIKEVISASIMVHKELGPGLLESVYEACLYKEFRNRGITFTNQHKVNIWYQGEQLEEYFRIDFVVENCLVIELKAVDYLLPIHEAQLITYLKLSGIETGLLMNFNTVLLKNGIKRLFRNKTDSKLK